MSPLPRDKRVRVNDEAAQAINRPLRAHSLILRLWPEPRDFEGEQPIWRGSVVELNGSNTRYFDNAQSLCDLIADLTGAESLRYRKLVP